MPPSASRTTSENGQARAQGARKGQEQPEEGALWEHRPLPGDKQTTAPLPLLPTDLGTAALTTSTLPRLKTHGPSASTRRTPPPHAPAATTSTCRGCFSKRPAARPPSRKQLAHARPSVRPPP
jgi:hypothetical protein